MEHPTHDGEAGTPLRLAPARRLLHRIGTNGMAAARFAALIPTLLRQARQVSRDVPRLPEAAGKHGIATTICRESTHVAERDLDPDSPHAYHLVVLGDSVAAGVGLDHHRNSLAGRLASLLSERCGHPVAWHVHARSGADAREMLTFTQDIDNTERLATCDAVVVSVGVNDLLGRHSATTWRRDLSTLLTRIITLNPTAPVVLLGVPPLEKFPAMPRELGTLLGRRAHTFDDISIDVASHLLTVHHLSLADPELATDKAFADDGFHPSTKMHKRIAKRAEKIVQAHTTKTLARHASAAEPDVA